MKTWCISEAVIVKGCEVNGLWSSGLNTGECDEVLSSEQELTDHQRTVHPNMCHVCFKFFVGENSFLAHFRQEHMNY